MTQSRFSMKSILERAGSAGFGGTLLVILAAASVLGTVILQNTLPGGSGEEMERQYGHGVWRVLDVLGLTDVFHALWYQAMLGLTGVSVLCATVTRFSLRREKIGFVLAHVGVLLVLGGGLVYFVRGEKGIVMLREGEASGKFESARAREVRSLPFVVRLDRFAVEHYPAEMVFVGPNREAVSVKPETGREVRLPWDGVRVRFERRLENARRIVEVRPGSTTEPEAAAHFSLSTAEHKADLWRFARHGDAVDVLVKTDGRITVTFSTEGPVGPASRRLPKQPTLFVINHSTGAVVEIPAEAGRTFQIPDVTPAASGEILEVLDDADKTALGPGLRMQIQGGGGMEWRHVFARFPDFVPDAVVTGSLGPGEVGFIYYRPRLVIEVVEKPGAVYEVRWRENGTRGARPMELHRPVEVGRVQLTLLEVLPSAHVETRYEEAGEPTGLEAVLLDVSSPDGGSKRFWMSTVGDEGRMKLDERLMIGYLASSDVREYRSEITIEGHGAGSESRVVRVNHPVRVGGWEIFQEGYSIDGMRRASRLAVVRDPGLTPVLVGLVMLSAGIFFACFVRPATGRREGGP
jgi:hypothetical protein